MPEEDPPGFKAADRRFVASLMLLRPGKVPHQRRSDACTTWLAAAAGR